DNGAIRFEYQTKDKIWRPLDTISGSFDTYCIPIQAATTGMIRVTAMDKCGNKTVKDFNFQDYPSDMTNTPGPPSKRAPLPLPLVNVPEIHEHNDTHSGALLPVSGKITPLPLPAEPVAPQMTLAPSINQIQHETPPTIKPIQQVAYST